MKRRMLTVTLILAMLATCFSFGAMAEEPVKATGVMYGSPGYTPTTDNMGTQYILETFGLDIDVLPVDVGTNDTWNIFWAADGYADIIIPYSLENALNIVNEDLCRTFDFDMIKEHAPRLYDLLLQTYGDDEAILKSLSIKGEVYCIPYFAVTNGLAWVSAIRNDWLEAVGLEVPKTVDELGEVMRAFTEDDPDGNGVKDTYGVNNIQYGLFNVAAAFGTSEALAFWVNDEGTDITSNATAEEYRTFLRQIADWYAAGYIDPEFITDSLDRAAVRSKWASGKFGILSDNPWWFEDARGETGPLRMLCDTDASVDFSTGFSFIGGQENADGEVYVNSLFSNLTGQASVYFGYDCPDEVIIKCLEMTNARVVMYDGTEEDYECMKTRARMDYGVEGTDWEWDDESKQVVLISAENAEYRTNNGLYIYPTAANMDLVKFEGQVDEFVIEAYELAGNLNKIYRTNNFAKPVLSNEASDQYDVIAAYFLECKNKFITGEMSLDNDWDAYVQQIEAYGLENVINEYKAGVGI